MLEGLLAPLRVVLQRSVADWLIVLATWLVIVCATTLLAIGVLYGDAVALSGLRQTLAAAPAAATSIDVQMRVEPEELAAVDEARCAQPGTSVFAKTCQASADFATRLSATYTYSPNR